MAEETVGKQILETAFLFLKLFITLSLEKTLYKDPKEMYLSLLHKRIAKV